MTSVVHINKSPYDLYIGRPSKWSNPYVIGRDGTRQMVLDKFRDYILNNPKLLSEVHELKGLTLGCWCKPQKCHGDILKELADNSITPISVDIP